MAILANDTKTAFKQLKTAILDKFNNLQGAGKVWDRYKYASGLDEWLSIATVETVAGIDVIRVIFITLGGFTSERVEARNVRITQTLNIEVIQGYADGEEQNSTEFLDDFTGDAIDAFIDDNALGFTDRAGQEVINSPLRGDLETDGRPVKVDGVDAHRKMFSIDVTFRRKC